MKRICVLGAAVAALLTAGIPALASAATSTTTTTTENLTARCTFGLVTALPNGSTSVLPGAPSGTQFGNSSCPKTLSKGTTHDSYQITTAGNFTAHLQLWFDVGSLKVTFDLKPISTGFDPTGAGFASQSFKGTGQVTGGTGALRGTTGTAYLRCTTLDQAHYSCRAYMKLTQATTSSSTTSSSSSVRTHAAA